MKSPWLSTLLSGAVLAQATHAQVFVPESYAIGFDLGQSYGTSAVHFKNGTTVNLAKVAGDAQYMSMMQRLTDLNYRPYKDVKRGDKLAEYWRNLKRSCGYATTEDAAILEQMVSQLKKESEAAFNKTIVRASFTAPLIKSWHDRDWWDNDLTDALLRAGLEPSLSAALKDQMYLTESRATLLDAEIETCQLPGRFKFDGKGRPILYINFDKHSLYTEILHTGCEDPKPSLQKSSIVSKIGPDNRLVSSRQSHFGLEMKLHLYGLAVQYVNWLQDAGFGVQDLGSVIVVGEDASDPHFHAALDEVVAALPCIANNPSESQECTDKAHQVLDGEYRMTALYPYKTHSESEPFAAARGAAKWGWMVEKAFVEGADGMEKPMPVVGDEL